MIIAPRPLTDRTLTRGELSDDKRKCLKIGPCGLGDKAIYLNSFYIDRIYYVPYTEVARVFKRVAMSRAQAPIPTCPRAKANSSARAAHCPSRPEGPACPATICVRSTKIGRAHV